MTEDVPDKKTKKIDKGQLYKPLSSDELHQLKDAENLFHSNVFKLQVVYFYQEFKQSAYNFLSFTVVTKISSI